MYDMAQPPTRTIAGVRLGHREEVRNSLDERRSKHRVLMLMLILWLMLN